MHALLQKHHLRPSTEPGSTRAGKPATSAIPPPTPTIHQFLRMHPAGLPPRAAPDDVAVVGSNNSSVRVVSSSSVGSNRPPQGPHSSLNARTPNRNFVLASVDDILQPNLSTFAPRHLPPAGGPPRHLVIASGNPEGNSSRANSAESERPATGIPTLHTDDSPLNHEPQLDASLSGRRLQRSLHQMLAEELAQFVHRQQAGVSSAAPRHEPSMHARSSGASTRADAAEGVMGSTFASSAPTHSDSKRKVLNAKSVAASVIAEGSVEDLLSILRATIVQLLSRGIGGCLEYRPSSRCPTAASEMKATRPHEAQRQKSAPPLTASQVLHTICSIYAEATGQAVDAAAVRGALGSSQRTATLPTRTSGPRDDDDGVSWESPQQGVSSAASPTRYSSMRRPSSVQLPNEASDDNRDAVWLRQLTNLRRERDEAREEIAFLQSELQQLQQRHSRASQ